jgi:hypothetical protein
MLALKRNSVTDRPPESLLPSIRSVDEALAPLDRIARSSISLVRKKLPQFETGGRVYQIPRYLFVGPRGGGEPIRVGLFAGAHGNEPEGTFALVDFVLALEEQPEASSGYCLFLYPILNPSGFEANTRLTASGVNIPNELWKNSISPEVFAIQSELWMHGFDGIVSLRTAPSGELTVAVGGPVFFRHLLAAALPSAQDLLPQAVRASHDALPPMRKVLLDEPNELIRAAPGLKPRPFEIVITLPSQVPLYLQKAAVTLLLRAILDEYRKFIAFGANL